MNFGHLWAKKLINVGFGLFYVVAPVKLLLLSLETVAKRPVVVCGLKSQKLIATVSVIVIFGELMPKCFRLKPINKWAKNQVKPLIWSVGTIRCAKDWLGSFARPFLFPSWTGIIGWSLTGLLPNTILSNLTHHLPSNHYPQLRQCYVNIEEILGKYGATLDNIVDETWFLTDISMLFSSLEALVGTRVEMFGKNPDMTQTAVEVSALIFPESLIEVKCVAQL